MSINLGTIQTDLSLNFKQFEAGLTAAVTAMRSATGQINASIASQESAMRRASTAAISAGAAIGGALAGSAEKAAKFQQQMLLLHTQAGATMGQVDGLSQRVLGLGQALGTAPEELAKGLYHIVSVGVPAGKQIDVLTAAAKGAKVGMADMEETTNALAGAMVSGIKGTGDAGDAMATLNAIVGAGNMRMGQLVSAISTGLLPAARNWGLSLKDVGAALATLTDAGMGAQDAATKLRMTFALMGSPSKAASKELARIGLSSKQLAEDMRKPNGLLVALVDLKQHLEKSGLSAVEQSQVLSNAFGRGKSSAGIMTLLENLERLNSKYKQIGQTAKDFGSDWEATQKSAAFQWDQFKAATESAAIKLGTVFLPMALEVIKALTRMVDAFLRVPEGTQRFIVEVAAASAVGLVLIGTGAKLVGALKLLGLTFGRTATEAETAMTGMATATTEAVTTMEAEEAGEEVALGAFSTAFVRAAATVDGAFASMAGAATGALNTIKGVLVSIPGAVATSISSAAGSVAGALEAMGARAAAAAATLPGAQAIPDMLQQTPSLQSFVNNIGDGLGIHGDVWPTKGDLDLRAHMNAMGQRKDAEYRDKGFLKWVDSHPASVKAAEKWGESHPQSADWAMLNPAAAATAFWNSQQKPGGGAAAAAGDPDLKRLMAQIADEMKNGSGVGGGEGGKKHKARKGKSDDTPSTEHAGEVLAKHLLDAVNLPSTESTCALFASRVMEKAGLAVPETAGAKKLADFVRAHAEKLDSLADLKAGDVVVWHGSKYGARQGKGGPRSGYHIGLYAGDGMVRESPHPGQIKTSAIYDPAHATGFRLHDSLLTAAGQVQALTSTKDGTKAASEQASNDLDVYQTIVAATQNRHAQAMLDASGKMAEWAKNRVPAWLMALGHQALLEKIRREDEKQATESHQANQGAILETEDARASATLDGALKATREHLARIHRLRVEQEEALHAAKEPGYTGASASNISASFGARVAAENREYARQLAEHAEANKEAILTAEEAVAGATNDPNLKALREHLASLHRLNVEKDKAIRDARQNGNDPGLAGAAVDAKIAAENSRYSQELLQQERDRQAKIYQMRQESSQQYAAFLRADLGNFKLNSQQYLDVLARIREVEAEGRSRDVETAEQRHTLGQGATQDLIAQLELSYRQAQTDAERAEILGRMSSAGSELASGQRELWERGAIGAQEALAPLRSLLGTLQAMGLAGSQVYRDLSRDVAAFADQVKNAADESAKLLSELKASALEAGGDRAGAARIRAGAQHLESIRQINDLVDRGRLTPDQGTAATNAEGSQYSAQLTQIDIDEYERKARLADTDEQREVKYSRDRLQLWRGYLGSRISDLRQFLSQHGDMTAEQLAQLSSMMDGYQEELAQNTQEMRQKTLENLSPLTSAFEREFDSSLSRLTGKITAKSGPLGMISGMFSSVLTDYLKTNVMQGMERLIGNHAPGQASPAAGLNARTIQMLMTAMTTHTAATVANTASTAVNSAATGISTATTTAAAASHIANTISTAANTAVTAANTTATAMGGAGGGGMGFLGGLMGGPWGMAASLGLGLGISFLGSLFGGGGQESTPHYHASAAGTHINVHIDTVHNHTQEDAASLGRRIAWHTMQEQKTRK